MHGDTVGFSLEVQVCRGVRKSSNLFHNTNMLVRRKPCDFFSMNVKNKTSNFV